MNDAPTITLIRKGKLYRSLDVQEIPRLGTDEVAARVTFANGGLIRRDMLDFSAARSALQKFKAAELLEMAQRAGCAGAVRVGSGGVDLRKAVDTILAE